MWELIFEDYLKEIDDISSFIYNSLIRNKLKSGLHTNKIVNLLFLIFGVFKKIWILSKKNIVFELTQIN